jgi:hypothetical protein
MDASQKDFFLTQVPANEDSWYSRMVLENWKRMKKGVASEDDLNALERGLVYFRDRKQIDVSKELRLLDRHRHPELYEDQPPEEEEEGDEGDEGDSSLDDVDYEDDGDDEGDEGDEAEEVDEEDEPVKRPKNKTTSE